MNTEVIISDSHNRIMVINIFIKEEITTCLHLEYAFINALDHTCIFLEAVEGSTPVTNHVNYGRK